MEDVFVTTRDSLSQLAENTGLTYKEINVLIWYIIVPLTWVYLLGLIRGKHKLSVVATELALLAWLTLQVSQKTDAVFDASCEFLLRSNVGGNYVNASVLICLGIPVFIYAILIPLAVVMTLKRVCQTDGPADGLA